ncbi:kinase-like domain-containing protein [Syncephalis fuscata]|nr:kinase-like domain-containing protein [Syncephalis fuscata]
MEYNLYGDTSPIDEFMPFAIFNQIPDIGEEEALGLGFLKCTYHLDWYDREVAALLELNKLDPEMLTIPAWAGYSSSMPLQNLINQLLTYFRTADGYGCIVLSLVEGITLREYARRLSPLQKDTELRDVARQLLITLAYLHRAGWIHGDLKPNNIMVQIAPLRTKGKPQIQVILIDFNLSLPTADGWDMPYGLVPGYTPPEIYLWEPLVIRRHLYSLFANRVAYEADYDENEKKIKWPMEKRENFMREMLDHQQHSYAPLNCSKHAKEFIALLMTIDPSKRPTMKEMMWHPWLK